MSLKECGKCGLEKNKENREFFYKNLSMSDGLSCWCIKCTKQQSRNNKKKKTKDTTEFFMWDESWIYI